MEGILGMIVVFLVVTILILAFSSLTGSKIKYRGGTIAEPDDLNKIVDKSRRLIDKDYKESKEKDEQLIEQLEPINREILRIADQRYKENELLIKKDISESEIKEYLDNKYNKLLFPLLKKKIEIEDNLSKYSKKKKSDF